MAIKAIILDTKYRYIETLSGDYSNGVFKYKRGGVAFGIGAKQGEMEFDYNLLVPNASGGGASSKVAYYMWDGKDHQQLYLGDKGSSSIALDYINYYKQGEYAKANVLKKPEGLEQIFKYMAFILIAVFIIGTYLAITNSVNSLKQTVQPITTIAHNINQTATYLARQSNITEQEAAKQLLFEENLTAYLRSHST